ncbi:MAG: hypothetical protein K8R58_14955 [Bacteroidales bacterium]|nr:hypothetical protein [Bacteroidales bacterium]
MDYQQQDLVKNIKSFIETFTTQKQNNYHDKEALESDIIWASSRFFASLLDKSKPVKVELSIDEFNLFVKEHEEKNNVKLNTKSLFEKYWLRNVLGRVKIAGTIESACRDFGKIKDLKRELEFLCTFYLQQPENNRKSIEKDAFEKALTKYENEQNIKLNRDRIYEPNWLHENDGIIEFSHIDIYFQPYLDSWEDFCFIHFLKELYYKEKKGNKINKTDVLNAYSVHSSLYPNTPTIETLKNQKVLLETEKRFYINFHNTDVRYWCELNDKICGYYWESLINDTSIVSDEDRIRIFLDNTFYWESTSNVLTNTTDKAKNRFLDASCKLVLNEPDIIGVDDEFSKIRIDGRMSRGIDTILYFDKTKESYALNNSDYFEMFKSFDLWENRAQTSYLHDQNSRDEFSYLISIIVKYDNEIEREETKDENNSKLFYYRRVKTLLKASITKPALLWDIVCYIKLYRREIIPYLLLNINFVSLSFRIIDGFSFPNEQKYNLKLELWKDCLALGLIVIRSESKKSILNSSKVIFQIFRQLNVAKFDIPYRRQSKVIEQELLQEKKNREKEILSQIENSPFNNQRQTNGEYLLPQLFNELLNCFSDFKIESLYKNGTVQFPLLQWDGFIWLMKCSTYWKYKPQFQKNIPDIHLLTNNFFKLYIKQIEIEEIETYNYIEQKKEVKLPTWSEKIESLESLNWLYPIYLFYKQQKLNSFLEPRFFFEKTDDYYNKKNKLIVSKLRTHIGVLLQVFKKLILPTIPYGFKNISLCAIKQRIEQQIIDYITTHIEDIPQEGKVDLFDYNTEWSYNSSEKEALLPQIARVINWFEKKEEVIEAFAKTKDINKILTLAESITSEGIKKRLIEKIKQADLMNFLENSNWIPEIQNTILKITQYPELIEEAKKVVAYWEENISKRKKEYEEYLFKTKLLIAYFNKDEKELNSINKPNKTSPITVGEPNYKDYKEFYIALIKIKEAPENSHYLFDDLAKRYPKYPVFALNRMAAKMNLANKNNDTDLYNEALEEWNLYASENESEIDQNNLGTTFYSNKIQIQFHLSNFEDLDSTFKSLDLPDRMYPDIIVTKVDSLISRNKIEEALLLLEEAGNYHKYSSKDELAFIQNLKVKVSGIDNIDELRVYYDRIFNNTPEKLIKIFPEKLNGRIDISEFIAKELAIAANKMLDKINSVSEIKKEDKYNDLVQLALESRVSTWGWTVKDQTRKAFSPSTKDNSEENLGEIDLDIQDYNKISFITCEAFILRDIPRVQSHIQKIITHYTNKRRAFLILVYFNGKQKDFKKKWGEYSTSIIPNLKYPSGFEMTDKSIVGLSANYGFDGSSVKIGSSEHGEGTNLYHVFVNLDYRISN